jgi:hypothetical protein
MIETKIMDDSEVFVEFVKELEGPGDGREVLRRYSGSFPRLAEELRALARARQIVDLGTTEARAGTECPETLGDFRIKGEIARGGMGAIYEAE